VVLALCLNPHAFSKETFTPYKAGEVPQNVTELWKDYDPRGEDLEVKVFKEWKDDGIVTRYITFKVGTFKGADSRIAAYYSYPDNGQKNPAFVWCHGGGQRAERSRGVYFAKQGFATVDINWGGRPLEEGIEENTDWGNVDPSQGPRFYSKALRKGWKRDLEPDEYTIDPVSSPRNNNWFLLVVAAKRAITFLEQQPQVNADRIGFAGFSMGGTVTSMTAVDSRLKAVAPFVGGTGHRDEDFPGGIEGSSLRQHFQNLSLYRKTVDATAHWPLVKCPVVFLSSSNDFNAAFERLYKAMALLKHKRWRVSSNIHENHKPSPEQWILLIQWFNQHLKGIDQKIPEMPISMFEIKGQTALFTVTPENFDNRLLDTEIYYSYDPNARIRFWNRADAKRSGESWIVRLPIYENLPLYTFANCRYKLVQEVESLQGKTSTLTLNSLEHSIIPENVDLAELAKLKGSQLVFEDFGHGLKDWAVREGGRSITTYKFQSPEFDFSNDKKLSFLIDPGGRKLSLNLQVDSRFLSQGLDLGGFSFSRSIEGDGPQEIVIDRHDFKSKKSPDKTLEWSKITRFYLSIVDKASKTKIDLTSEEGRGILKKISLVK
jgi:dienelactone hydrolase